MGDAGGYVPAVTEPHVYPDAERPDVEMLWAGVWCRAECEVGGRLARSRGWPDEPPTNSSDRQQLHARLADAMEAYADAVAIAGVALPAHFSEVMKVHRSEAGSATSTVDLTQLPGA